MSDEKKNPETLPSQGYFGGGHGTYAYSLRESAVLRRLSQAA